MQYETEEERALVKARAIHAKPAATWRRCAKEHREKARSQR